MNMELGIKLVLNEFFFCLFNMSMFVRLVVVLNCLIDKVGGLFGIVIFCFFWINNDWAWWLLGWWIVFLKNLVILLLWVYLKLV